MRYGLIGESPGNNYSREIHEKIACHEYELLELQPEDIGAFLEKRGFAGISIAAPYMQAVIPYLDGISEQAKSIGAVNTVVNRDGKLYGHNTDFDGMCSLLRHTGINVRGRKALIFGTGDTSKTAAAVMKSLGADGVISVPRREGEKAAALHGDAQIIINTTPEGMLPDGEVPIDISAFPALEGVIDTVYDPLRTDLVWAAQKRGIPAEGGLYMLCAQAVYAEALFTGREADPALTDEVFGTLRREKENIVLIGMPTSGKTTVGRLLARRVGKRFCDTDALIEEKNGIKTAEYIRNEGIAAFRVLEKAAIASVSADTGCVIATGGGAVLDPDNVRRLAGNGAIIFLDRPIEKLFPSPERPLSSDADSLKRLFAERYPIYSRAADIRIEVRARPDAAADAILKELGYEDIRGGQNEGKD